MSNLFIDTSGWANYFIATELHNIKTVSIFQKSRANNQRIITTNYVIAELVALLGSRYRIPRDTLFQCVDSIRHEGCIDIIHIDSALDSYAWQLCKSRPDKNWSLVDASSFIVMKQLSISAALTTDKHFEQAGFVRLLK